VQRGFYQGDPDGQIGAKTRGSLAKIPGQYRPAPDGFASAGMRPSIGGRTVRTRRAGFLWARPSRDCRLANFTRPPP